MLHAADPALSDLPPATAPAPDTTAPLRILYAEDHPCLAIPMRSHIIAHHGAQEVALCRNARQVREQLDARQDWSTVLLDLDMPGSLGLSLVREVCERGMASRCAVITASENPDWPVEAKALGVLGYILKSGISLDEFEYGLTRVIQGKRYYTHLLSGKLTEPMRLTRRQIQVLNLLYQGVSTPQIASHLAVSIGTVNNHIAAIIHALRAKDRTHAVALGVDYGYIQRAKAVVGDDICVNI